MKQFTLGLIVGATVCSILFVFGLKIFEKSFNYKRNVFVDQLYFEEPREGCMAEWAETVFSLPPDERNLVYEKLERSTETFLSAYIDLNLTNQNDWANAMYKYFPVKKLIQKIGCQDSL